MVSARADYGGHARRDANALSHTGASIRKSLRGRRRSDALRHRRCHNGRYAGDGRHRHPGCGLSHSDQPGQCAGPADRRAKCGCRCGGAAPYHSDLETQPAFAPDIYESGTLNTAGLAGLAAGATLLWETGVEEIEAHEQALAARFLAGAAAIPGLTVYGPTDPRLRTGVVSFNLAGLMPSEVGYLLDQRWEILCRVGLHCAPAAHRTLGSFPTGSVRFSWGSANTLDEIDFALAALADIEQTQRSVTAREAILA